MSETAYRVLARKYRPSRFEDLIGQDTLVRTLTNALASGRIAHAFMLTGVRGVGKTTTARLIARALNCVHGPTITPCGTCDACVGIAADRHPDVIEMDAASRTGIGDIRELIETVRYRPVSARFKIYIIDEVHMLSTPAFNALLKTLEEPPPDIKFVFATTEINKVPVTVLSRCQRYTLPRIPIETLTAYYGEIAAKESAAIEPAALALIGRAADGSVRDGLSILDQAIALAFGQTITVEATRHMLGVADRAATFDLFEMVMHGDAPGALDRVAGLYRDGAEPARVIQDLLDITHFVTRLKLERTDTAVERAAVAAAPAEDGQDRQRGLALAGRLGMGALARAWQMLLKGLAEIHSAPQQLQAAEMILIRLAYVTDLPPPAEIVKSLSSSSGGGDHRSGQGVRPAPQALASSAPQSVSLPPAPARPSPGNGATAAAHQPVVAALTDHEPMPAPTIAASTDAELVDFEAVLDRVAARREAILFNQLASLVHPVRFEAGLIEFRPEPSAPRDLAARLGQFLLNETGKRWMLSVSGDTGGPTFREIEASRHVQALAEVRADPLVQAVLAAFPGAWIDRIDDRKIAAEVLPAGSLPEEAVTDAVELPYEDEDDPGPFAEAPWDAGATGDD